MVRLKLCSLDCVCGLIIELEWSNARDAVNEMELYVFAEGRLLKGFKVLLSI